MVSKGNLKKGDTITRDNITAKRTGGRGVSALDFYNVLGATLTRDLSQDHPIEETHLDKRIQ